MLQWRHNHRLGDPATVDIRNASGKLRECDRSVQYKHDRTTHALVNFSPSHRTYNDLKDVETPNQNANSNGNSRRSPKRCEQMS